MRVSRRALLGSATLGVVAVSAGVAVPFAANARHPRQAVMAVVKHVFGDHVLPPEALAQFADGYIARNVNVAEGREGRILAGGLPMLLPLLAVAPRSLSPEKLGSRIHDAETRVAHQFILATNYRTRTPRQLVAFTGFQDPAPLLCMNPLARFDADD